MITSPFKILLLQLSSRAIVDSENISVINPDFINDWENMNSIVLNTSTPENKNVITLPWGAGSSSQQYLKSQSVNYELVNCRRLDNFDLQGYDFDLLSFMLDDENGSLELLYYNKESNISVYKMNKNFYGEIYVNTSGYYKDNCQLVYDWSGIKDDTFVLIVTVDQIFDFNGKEIQVSSAKHFKAEFEMLPNWYYIYPVGVSYVVNKDQILER